jgi:hypothetical protein
MLKHKIAIKRDLMKLLQSVQIKKIIAADIRSKDDLNKMIKEADQMVRSNLEVTMFVRTT